LRFDIVTPFTDVAFRPSDWRPKAWRKAEGMHYGSVTSSFPSRKADRGSIFCESTLESDMACLLEVDAGVRHLREQPVGPAWHDGYGWHPGTARDFWVETDLGNVLVEVKEARELADPDVRHRLSRMALSYRVQGICMVVRSERTIRRQPRLDNARILHGYAYGENRRLESDLRLMLTRRAAPMTIGEIRSEMGGDPETLETLCRLALAGVIDLDLSCPLGAASLVSWG
jgi:hypothetical protein